MKVDVPTVTTESTTPLLRAREALAREAPACEPLLAASGRGEGGGPTRMSLSTCPKFEIVNERATRHPMEWARE